MRHLHALHPTNCLLQQHCSLPLAILQQCSTFLPGAYLQVPVCNCLFAVAMLQLPFCSTTASQQPNYQRGLWALGLQAGMPRHGLATITMWHLYSGIVCSAAICQHKAWAACSQQGQHVAATLANKPCSLQLRTAGGIHFVIQACVGMTVRLLPVHRIWHISSDNMEPSWALKVQHTI